MTVREHMDPAAVFVSPGDSCREAWQVIDESGLDGVPVISGGRLVGVVTLADIRQRAPHAVSAAARGELASALLTHARISGVMALSPPSIEASAKIEEAARRMVDRGVTFLPVLDDRDRLVGTIGIRRILATLLDQAGQSNGGSSRWEVSK